MVLQPRTLNCQSGWLLLLVLNVIFSNTHCALAQLAPPPVEQRAGSVPLNWRNKNSTPPRAVPTPAETERLATDATDQTPTKAEQNIGPTATVMTTSTELQYIDESEETPELQLFPAQQAIPETLPPAVQRREIAPPLTRQSAEPWRVQSGPEQLAPQQAAPGEAWHAEPYDRAAPLDELWSMPRMFQPESYNRFTGRGEPLLAGSWLNRPYYIGGFLGGITGDTLIPGEINQNGGLIWGLRLGWDYDHYWGIEGRLAFAEQGLDYLAVPTLDSQNNDLVLWDVSLVYYPWGDARWRPYLSAGFGLVDYDFNLASGIRRSESVFGTPLGIGLKYRVNKHWTWRIEVVDNIAWGAGASFETQNQFSFAAGLELRFGGTSRSYWPWNSSLHWR